jgi:hypothetical protein
LGRSCSLLLLSFALRNRTWSAAMASTSLAKNALILPPWIAAAIRASLRALRRSLQFPFGPSSQSDLYPTIQARDRLLGTLLPLRVRTGEETGERPLLDVLVPAAGNEHVRRMKGIRRLRKHVVQAAKDSETGIVSLEVTTKDPDLSAHLANALVAELEQYLISIRQNEGRKNRTFIDERLAEVSTELAGAETRLTRFREGNRRIAGSPELQLEEARLHRDVLTQEQVFLELQKQTEIAEIEEVKNTPVLKILDEATPPVKPSRPMRTLMVVGGVLLGIFVAISWVALRVALRDSPDLAAALAPISRDFARVHRVFARPRTPTAG